MGLLGEEMKKRGVKGAAVGQQPLWRGPQDSGITFSLLSRFLVDRERFRLLVLEGKRAADTFNPRLEFGNFWHLCEEAYARAKVAGVRSKTAEPVAWFAPLLAYARDLCGRYPTQQDAIDNWHQICRTMFPLYVDYWREHPDQTKCVPLLQEQVFSVPYQLPSGRIVRLRGKWDSVDLVGKEGVYLQENKTKSEVNEGQLVRQLNFDLQTMFYLVALEKYNWTGEVQSDTVAKKPFPVAGVRYNVIRRPRQYQGKKETRGQFLDRLHALVRENPQDFFYRWKVEVTAEDIHKFKVQCFDPLLENLCDWWEWITSAWAQSIEPWGRLHWRYPYGVYNVLLEGGSTEFDEYLRSGSEIGLQKTANLFPELS